MAAHARLQTQDGVHEHAKQMLESVQLAATSCTGRCRHHNQDTVLLSLRDPGSESGGAGHESGALTRRRGDLGFACLDSRAAGTAAGGIIVIQIVQAPLSELAAQSCGLDSSATERSEDSSPRTVEGSRHCRQWGRSFAKLLNGPWCLQLPFKGAEGAPPQLEGKDAADAAAAGWCQRHIFCAALDKPCAQTTTEWMNTHRHIWAKVGRICLAYAC
ncbi:unnamed protein product [Phytophthora fragariaefolia]|uniref:Unnamed protein product n=1 Tax=Phytophthora fragariaefolia TaxID=1490495 RepID=A0A9W6XU46_9STRA|nr:unnamed protein product [Phytophthora fragariaefolia]